MESKQSRRLTAEETPIFGQKESKMSQDSKKEIPISKRFFPPLLPIIGEEKYERVYVRYCDLYANRDLPQNPFK